VPEEPRPPNPTDGAVIYRTRWNDDLHQAATVLARHGIPAAPEWRASNALAGMHWRTREGDGEGWLIVPEPEVARARVALEAWKQLEGERLRGHSRDVGWQLAFVLLLGLAFGGLPFFLSSEPGRQPLLAATAIAAVLALGLYVLVSWRRSRARRRQ
jgi:hypothetical protein